MPKGKAGSDAERNEGAEEYMAAAREHFAALQRMGVSPDHYPLAYYLAGLTAECLFRAYAELNGAEHDAGHDLRRHAESGRFFLFMPESKRDGLRDYLNEVWKRWLNNHRYRSLSSLRHFLTDAELYRLSGQRTIQGDIVDYNWSILFESTASLLVGGIEQWKNSKNKLNRS